MRLAPLSSFFALLAMGCQPVPAGSDLDHMFSKTSRTSNRSLTECHQETASHPTLQRADRYVAAIAKYVMEKNPDSFQNLYAPEKFCFSVRANDAVNAFAKSWTREVFIFTGMLEILPTDAHMAAVIAHELAHVTMQHDDELEADEVESDRRWQAEGPALKNNLSNLSAQQTKLDGEQEALYAEQERLEKAFDKAETPALKTMRAEVETLFYALHEQLSPLVTSGRKDYLSFISLSMMVRSAAPRFSLESEEIGSEGAPSVEYLAILEKVETYRAKRAAWIAAEGEASPTLAANYRSIIQRSEEVREGYARLYRERDVTTSRLQDIRKSVMGERLESWREQEADEVGLEFHLRAGLAPLSFQGMFEALNVQEQQNAASCAMQAESNMPKRGSESHPSPCWRYYNAKVLEMGKHAESYRSFLDAATRTSIAPGELAAIQQELKAIREGQP